MHTTPYTIGKKAPVPTSYHLIEAHVKETTVTHIWADCKRLWYTLGKNYPRNGCLTPIYPRYNFSIKDFLFKYKYSKPINFLIPWCKCDVSDLKAIKTRQNRLCIWFYLFSTLTQTFCVDRWTFSSLYSEVVWLFNNTDLFFCYYYVWHVCDTYIRPW